LGEPISPHLRRSGPFAVDDHSFMGRALHPTTYILNNIVLRAERGNLAISTRE
jgi:hypothetical protein